MNVQQMADEVHAKAMDFARAVVDDNIDAEPYRELMELDDLYKQDPLAYLVYRAVSSTVEDGFTPVWFHAEQVAEQIGADDAKASEVEDAISRLIEMVMSIDLGDGSIVIPLIPLFTTYVDATGRNIYFATAHGIGGAFIVKVAEYARGASSEDS